VATPPPGERARDLSLLSFGVALLVFASPLRLIWAAEGRPWYLPFVLWLLVGLLAFWVARADARREGP
jgi:hypothetical protein